MEQIELDDVKITGMYDEELQELQDNKEEEEEECGEYVNNVDINQTSVVVEEENS